MYRFHDGPALDGSTQRDAHRELLESLGDPQPGERRIGQASVRSAATARYRASSLVTIPKRGTLSSTAADA